MSDIDTESNSRKRSIEITGEPVEKKPKHTNIDINENTEEESKKKEENPKYSCAICQVNDSVSDPTCRFKNVYTPVVCESCQIKCSKLKEIPPFEITEFTYQNQTDEDNSQTDEEEDQEEREETTYYCAICEAYDSVCKPTYCFGDGCTSIICEACQFKCSRCNNIFCNDCKSKESIDSTTNSYFCKHCVVLKQYQ